MKYRTFMCLLFLCGAGLNAETSLNTNVEKPNTTRIIGTVADGSPAPKIEERPAPVFTVKSSRTVRLPDRKITIRHVAKPITESRLLPVSGELPEIVLDESGSGISETELLHISATVHAHSLTQVRGWTQNGQEFSAWTDIDFNNFSGFSSFVHQGKQYGLIMGIGNEETYPADAKFPPVRDSFLLEKNSACNPQVRGIAEAFTALFKSERNTLEAARLGRESAARIAAAKPPALPGDITISIWDKPSRSLTPAEKATRDKKKEAAR